MRRSPLAPTPRSFNLDRPLSLILYGSDELAATFTMATPESHTPPAPASAAASETATAPTAAAAAASRRIPGLAPGLVPPAPQPKQRKRAPKKQTIAAASSSPSVPATPNPDVPIPPEAKSAGNDKADADEADELLRLQETKSNAAEVVQKRLRATTKKVQRIEGYEASTVALNPDQQRAVQGKSALQAVVRELTELSALLKSDDEENSARQQRLRTLYEKQQTRAVEAATKIAQVRRQASLQRRPTTSA